MLIPNKKYTIIQDYEEMYDIHSIDLDDCFRKVSEFNKQNSKCFSSVGISSLGGCVFVIISPSFSDQMELVISELDSFLNPAPVPDVWANGLDEVNLEA